MKSQRQQRIQKRRPRTFSYRHHGEPKFYSIKPKIDTNNPRKKISKEKHEKALQEWRLKRGKGQEPWNKNTPDRKKVVSTKYSKYKVCRKY